MKKKLKIQPEHLKLSRLLFLELKEKLSTKKAYPKPQLPDIVNDYKLIEIKKNQSVTDTNSLGLYQNGKGKKAFGKIINFTYHNIEYYRLLNEIAMYITYDKHVTRIRKAKKEVNLRMPKLLFVEEKQNSLFLLLEFIEGLNVKKLSPEQKIKIYVESTTNLVKLGESFTELERALFSKRTQISYLLLYPLLIMMAIKRHPKTTKFLIRGLLVVITKSYLLVKHQKLVLSHRDLHLKNIILGNCGAFLIDFESVGITVPLYDYIVTLRHEWGNTKFRRLLIKQIEQKYSYYKNFESNFRLFVVLVGTHALTASGYTSSEVQRTESFLKYGLDYRFKN